METSLSRERASTWKWLESEIGDPLYLGKVLVVQSCLTRRNVMRLPLAHLFFSFPFAFCFFHPLFDLANIFQSLTRQRAVPKQRCYPNIAAWGILMHSHVCVGAHAASTQPL